MTFTYNTSIVTDITRVRYHTGDTVEAAAIFSDEDITFVISEEGGYQAAVISCLQHLIARISAEPDMTADWLKIDLGRSLEGYQALLTEKRRAFDIAAITATSKPVYRADSKQTSAPDW